MAGCCNDLVQCLGRANPAPHPTPTISSLIGAGNSVKPKLYVACGISGAREHLHGMKESEVIVAINQDAEAPIFEVAHYGIVGDVNEILPALIERAKRT